MPDMESLQCQIDVLSSALGHVIEAMRSLHDLEDLSAQASDPKAKRVKESLRVAVDNMNELNRLRVA